MVVVVVFNHPSTGFFKKVTQQVKDSGQEKRKTSCFSRPFNGALLDALNFSTIMKYIPKVFYFLLLLTGL